MRNIRNKIEINETALQTSMPESMDEIYWGELPRTNELSHWTKALESRLNKQRKELVSLLNYADENINLIPDCVKLRREMERTKALLSDCYFLCERLN